MAGFYEGYTKRVEENEQAPMRDLQQLGSLVQLRNSVQAQRAAAQEQQSNEALKAAIAAIPPEKRTRETVLPLVLQHTRNARELVPLLKSETEHADRLAAIKSREDEAANRFKLQEQNAQMLHEFRMSQLKGADERAAETKRYNDARLAAQAEQAKATRQMELMRLEMTGERQKAEQLRNVDRQVTALGTSLERANLPEADATLRAVEDALNKNPNLASYLSGPKSLAPDLLVGPEIAAGRQAFQKLFNITLKNRSGAAVTIPELERLKQEFATGAWKTPEQLKAGVEQARNIIAQHYKAVAAGFGPDVLKQYNENLRQIGGTPLLEGSPVPAAPKPSGGTPPPPPGFKINP